MCFFRHKHTGSSFHVKGHFLFSLSYHCTFYHFIRFWLFQTVFLWQIAKMNHRCLSFLQTANFRDSCPWLRALQNICCYFKWQTWFPFNFSPQLFFLFWSVSLVDYSWDRFIFLIFRKSASDFHYLYECLPFQSKWYSRAFRWIWANFQFSFLFEDWLIFAFGSLQDNLK